tara:strand:+ start:2453 stop:3019 length:567 start_codon:yes stop_codon:yes gene_type:complete
MSNGTPWMRVSSGAYINLAEITPEDVSMFDVVAGLNNIRRCCGHGADRDPLTVLQHSMLVADLAYAATGSKRLGLHGQLHDAHEAYIGDTTTPVKTLTGYIEPVNVIRAVRDAFDLNDYGIRLIKPYDTLALDIERKSLWTYNKADDKYWPPVEGGLTEQEAEAMFDEYASKTAEDFYLMIQQWEEPA